MTKATTSSGRKNEPTEAERVRALWARYLHPGETLPGLAGQVDYPNPARFPPFEFVVYRPEIYELPSRREQLLRGEGRAPGAGHATEQGGVWDVGNPDEFRTFEDVLNIGDDRFPAETFGPDLVEACARMAEAVPDDRIPMARQYATLVVRAILEFGWEPLLLAAGMDPERFGRILDRFGEASLAIFRAWAQVDSVPVLYLHDDIAMTRGLMFSPDWFRQYVFPWYRRFVDAMHETGKKVMYVSDGNYLQVLDDILDTGMDGFTIDTIAMEPGEFMARAGRDKFYRVGVSPRTLEFGKPEEVKAELRALHELQRQYPALWLIGRSLSADHPNAKAYDEALRELFSTPD